MPACRSVLALIASLLLAGCGATANAPQTLYRADGSPIHWSLEVADSGVAAGVLLVAQGSGCAPAATSSMVREAWAIAPGMALLTIEKVGVEPGDEPDDPIGDCSAAYASGHTVSQRAADARAVIAHLEAAGTRVTPLVLFGGSEGGATVARLASTVAANAVIVYSAGIGEPLAHSLKRVVPPVVASELDDLLERVRANPELAGDWGGNSYRWWADIAEARLVDEMMISTAPVLIIQGDRDPSAPVEAARAAAAAYTAAGRCELTYHEYPGYDHFMADERGIPHRDRVFARARAWLSDALRGRTGCGA